MSTTTRAAALLDRVLAHAVESVWLQRPMPRAHVSAFHYDEERARERAAGEDSAVLDVLRQVLDAARTATDRGLPMDGELVDRWRAESDELR